MKNYRLSFLVTLCLSVIINGCAWHKAGNENTSLDNDLTLLHTIMVQIQQDTKRFMPSWTEIETPLDKRLFYISVENNQPLTDALIAWMKKDNFNVFPASDFQFGKGHIKVGIKSIKWMTRNSAVVFLAYLPLSGITGSNSAESPLGDRRLDEITLDIHMSRIGRLSKWNIKSIGSTVIA